MDSVFVIRAIMMIIKIHYANNALNFGIFIKKNYLLCILINQFILSTICSNNNE